MPVVKQVLPPPTGYVSLRTSTILQSLVEPLNPVIPLLVEEVISESVRARHRNRNVLKVLDEYEAPALLLEPAERVNLPSSYTRTSFN